MCLHPLGGFDEEVHLLGLLVALLLHDGRDLIALLALLQPLLVLVLDQRQLVVRLVELLISRLLLTRLVLHLQVVRVQVLRVQTIRLLVLLSELVLISLILLLEHVVLTFEGVDLLLECSHLSDMCVLNLLVHAGTPIVQLLNLLVTVGFFSADRCLQALYVSFPLDFLLPRLFLVLLQVLLLLVPDLPELLGPRVEYPQLLLNRVLLLERPRQLRPPQRLHLLERLDQLRVLRQPLVAHALL